MRLADLADRECIESEWDSLGIMGALDNVPRFKVTCSVSEVMVLVEQSMRRSLPVDRSAFDGSFLVQLVVYNEQLFYAASAEISV
jgi:hypothetical protein